MRQDVSRRGRTAPTEVRIIGGRWRGRRLPVIDAPGLRPSGDRIRETLFNWLQFELPGWTCLDLFAGTGVLGLESLSRGAAHCDFVEPHGAAAKSLRSNISAMGLDDSAQVYSQTAQAFLRHPPRRYDLVFVDPPFDQELWEESLTAIVAHLNAAARVYVERPASYSAPWSQHWEVLRDKRAGEVQYSLLRLRPDNDTA